MGKQNGKVRPEAEAKTTVYTWEQQARSVGYIVTVGELDDAAREFGEFEDMSGDYCKCTHHIDIDAAEEYMKGRAAKFGMTYEDMIKQSRVAYTGFLAESVGEEAAINKGWVTPEVMNEARSAEKNDYIAKRIAVAEKSMLDNRDQRDGSGEGPQCEL